MTDIPDRSAKGLVCDGCGQKGFRCLEIIGKKHYCINCSRSVKANRNI